MSSGFELRSDVNHTRNERVGDHAFVQRSPGIKRRPSGVRSHQHCPACAEPVVHAACRTERERALKPGGGFAWTFPEARSAKHTISPSGDGCSAHFRTLYVDPEQKSGAAPRLEKRVTVAAPIERIEPVSIIGPRIEPARNG